MKVTSNKTKVQGILSISTIVSMILTLGCMGFIPNVSCSLFAQANNFVKIKLHQPPPNKFNLQTLWKLTLTNSSKEAIEVYLTANVSEVKDGKIAEGKTKPFVLKPGSVTYGYDDFKNGTAKWVGKSGNKYEEVIMRTGNAPSGDYTFCVTAYSVADEEVGSETCMDQSIELDSEQEITLLSPDNGTIIEPQEGVLFQWIPITPMPKEGYVLTVVEIMGKQSKEEAIKTNIPILKKAGLKSTSWTEMGNSSQILTTKVKGDRRFAWRVTGGEGISEVSTFIVRGSASCGTIKDSVVAVCSGTGENGRPKYLITLFMTNIPTNNDLACPSICSDITTTSGSITNVSTTFPFSIAPNVTVTVTFNYVPNNTADANLDFVVYGNWTDGRQNSTDFDGTVNLPRCNCNTCDSIQVNFSQLSISPSGITGNINVNRPIFGIEMSVLSYDYNANPIACSNGVSVLEASGIFITPTSTINGQPVILMNETVSGSGSGSNNNISKTLKYISSTALNGNIPINLSVGLPQPLTGLNSECCRMTYNFCIRVRVFYEENSCKSCVYNYCFPAFNN